MKQVITDGRSPTARFWRRLAWFVGIWAASVTALAIVATLLRWVIMP